MCVYERECVCSRASVCVHVLVHARECARNIYLWKVSCVIWTWDMENGLRGEREGTKRQKMGRTVARVNGRRTCKAVSRNSRSEQCEICWRKSSNRVAQSDQGVERVLQSAISCSSKNMRLEPSICLFISVVE